jgi:hypothetical protein
VEGPPPTDRIAGDRKGEEWKCGRRPTAGSHALQPCLADGAPARSYEAGGFLVLAERRCRGPVDRGFAASFGSMLSECFVPHSG